MSGTAVLGDRTVHRLGFGSMRITANPDRDLAIRVLRRAVELGVDHIDTAAFYVSPGGTLGVGTGEKRYATELIRAALSPYPQNLVIATKVGAAAGDRPATAAELRTRVEDNLRRLGVDTLDVVNLRLRDRGAALGEQFTALADLRREGLIRHLGISNVRPHHLDEAQAIAPVACVQNEYGFDLRDADGTALLHECARRGIAFVPYFSLAGSGREQGATGGPGGAALRAAAAAHGVTEHQIRLAWILHRGPHVLAIPGTGNVEHLEQNMAAGKLRLTGAELAAL
ncbi:aldo/keto reductase [Actinoplanes sp. NPDC049316]|uniref:aldo/keto reductase n=1 Tax=Actinoplanes sp. NPDC049316 TaxID=3154727 RepID=UPI003417FF63